MINGYRLKMSSMNCDTLAVTCEEPPEIVLVLDASGSIVDKGARNWDLMKRFASNLVTGLSSRKGVQFAVVRFSDEAEVDLELTRYSTCNNLHFPQTRKP